MTKSNWHKALQWGAARYRALTNVAFCLTACEIFFIYRNFRTSEPVFGSAGVPLMGSLVATSIALVVCIVMVLAYALGGKRIARRRQFVLAAGCTAVASGLQLVFGHGLSQGWAALPCIALASAGCACFVPELVRRMAPLGVTNMVRCCIASCLILLIAAPFANVVPFAVFCVAMMVMPLAVLACFLLCTSVYPPVKSDPQLQRQKLPVVLLLTIVLGSLMEGIVAALDETAMDWWGKLVVFSVGFMASGAVVFATLLHWRGSYNNAIFRQCIPVMAAGIAVFAIQGSYSLDLGTFVFLIGRQMFITVVMALMVYLIRNLESDYYLLSLGVMLGATSGSVVGQLLFYYLGSSSAEELVSPAFLVILLLVVFTVAMYLSDASNTKTRWGMTSIVDEGEEGSGMSIEQCCRVLAQAHRLTPREREIMVELAKGKDRPSVAAKLFISEGTVKVHSRNLYQKLGIHSKQELISLVEQTIKSSIG